MKTIGIIGPGASLCSNEIYHFGIEIGKLISKYNFNIVCGGLGGIMESVCKGAKENKTSATKTIGILPSENKNDANKYIDIIIPSGMGIARNLLIVNSSDILIAIGGGSGTLSELAFAWQKNKIVLCVAQFDGWAAKLAGKNIDKRYNNLMIKVNTLKEIESFLSSL